MKITLDIPEWAIGKHIYILAGQELLAIKEARVKKDHTIFYLPLKVKPEKGRCVGCGSCCKSGHSKFMLKRMYETLDKYLEKKSFSSSSPCPYLGLEGCILGPWIPLSCVRSVCSSYDGCSEHLEEVD